MHQYSTVIQAGVNSPEIEKVVSDTRFDFPTIQFKLTSPDSVEVEIGWPLGSNWPGLARVTEAMMSGELDELFISGLMKFAISHPTEAASASDLQNVLMQIFRNRDLRMAKRDQEDESDDGPIVDPDDVIGYNLQFPHA